jgi:hypothetical protein
MAQVEQLVFDVRLIYILPQVRSSHMGQQVIDPVYV